jgi:uncharacterized membrane protein
MSLAQKIYEQTDVRQLGIAAVTTGMPFRVTTISEENYRLFRKVVEELDVLAAAGLIKILNRSREARTGKRHVDVVRFRRLA